jgi:hypothetical protein
MKRLLLACVVLAVGCVDFERLEKDALAALDGGGVDGGASGGMAGGGGAGGGVAGGGVGGGAPNDGGPGDGGMTDGGMTDGGAGCTATLQPAFPLSCGCLCDGGACPATCSVRRLRPGGLTFVAPDLVALSASSGLTFVVTEGAALLVLDSSLSATRSIGIPGDFLSLDARRGVALVVTPTLVSSSSGLVVSAPPFVSSFLGGALYDRGMGLEVVALARLVDGGFEAFDVSDAGLGGSSRVDMPTGSNDRSTVIIRPDQAGMVGRYLLRAGPGTMWRYRFFSGSSVMGFDPDFSANQALLATSEAQEAVLAIREASGISRLRPLGATRALSTTSVRTSSAVDLRALVTVDAGLSSPVDVYLLERNGTAPAPTFANVELTGGVNDWFVVVDRPSGLIVYALGDVDTAYVAAPSATTLVVVSRCTTATGMSVCQAGAGTWAEVLPLQ